MKVIEITSKIEQYQSAKELPENEQLLIEKAYEYAQYAHAPYSNFKVGCAIKLENGKIVGGSNQENASYPAGICAERTALSSCASQFPNVAIEKMAIVVNDENFLLTMPTAPCGICRQTIQEVEGMYNKQIQILFPGENGSFYKAESIKSLLPLSFKAKHLNNH